jgi:hypothetical protein
MRVSSGRNQSTMGDAIITERHGRSGRTALIADEGDSIWLYLTEPDTTAIAADCWLFNRVIAPTPDVLKEQLPGYRTRGLPPPAPADLAADRGIRPGPVQALDLRLEWSREGDAVAVGEGDEVIGFIAIEQRRGFSRFLVRESPWGAPFDDELFARLFRPERG